MAVIEKGIRLRGSKGDEQIVAIFDSGATYSCIQKRLAERLEIVVPLPDEMRFGTAKEGVEAVARYCVRLDFYINNDRFSDEFMVIEGLADRVIIGAKTLQSWRMKLDFEEDDIIYDPRVTKLRIV